MGLPEYKGGLTLRLMTLLPLPSLPAQDPPMPRWDPDVAGAAGDALPALAESTT